MKLRLIRLQHFRNIAGAELAFAGERTFLLGPNGQGKTNLLEAIGYVSALRAFRPGDNRTLIQQGQAEAALAFRFGHETLGESEVIVRIRPKGKEATLDGEPVRRLSDYIGRFPTVLFASEDIQLVRGGPALRRRLLDLHLASLDPAYLADLQAYHRALDARNRLLKEAAGAAQISAFEHQLAPAACRLIARRREGVARLAALVADLYVALSGGAEPGSLAYTPDCALEDPALYLAQLERGRPRDLLARSSQHGPHRDDLALAVAGREAALYASEGQQRALVLALRFAQLRDARAERGIAPLVLADDVLGELDPVRRARFWGVLDPDLQLFATGTTPPGGERDGWRVIHVEGGTFRDDE
ncbi:MAG: DNA replication and repair protein RecF [Opitutaceae bacterium]|nr:DNA replication and repair protein RecF [Opitutaceae bacterium]